MQKWGHFSGSGTDVANSDSVTVTTADDLLLQSWWTSYRAHSGALPIALTPSAEHEDEIPPQSIRALVRRLLTSFR